MHATASRHIRTRGALLATGLAVLIAAGCAAPSRDIRFETGSANVTADGLHRIHRPQFGRAFARPGVDLSVYNRIIIMPVIISYQRVRTREGRQSFALSEAQATRMRDAFQEAFARELARSEVFTVTTERGPDALMVFARVVDLEATLPPRARGSEHRFVRESGAMTLILDLRDSVTGQPLVRIADRRAARADGGAPYRALPVTDQAAVRRLFQQWASDLRRRLDEVREIPPLEVPTS